VNAGFHLLAEGADQLSKGLTEGAAKLRAAIWIEEATGLSLTGKPAGGPAVKSDSALSRTSAGLLTPSKSGAAVASGLKQASAVLQWSQGMPVAWNLPALSSAFEAMSQESAPPSKPKGAAPSAKGAAPAMPKAAVAQQPKLPARDREAA